MEEALELFGEIANSKWLRPADEWFNTMPQPVILFLNKVRKEGAYSHLPLRRHPLDMRQYNE
jgi:hypothetical protein